MHDNERGRIRTQERFRRENWSFFSKKFSTIIFRRDTTESNIDFEPQFNQRARITLFSGYTFPCKQR